jgi:hypothetical protein
MQEHFNLIGFGFKRSDMNFSRCVVDIAFVRALSGNGKRDPSSQLSQVHR